MNLTSASSPRLSADRRRWAALIVVCLAQLMIVLDVTIVNVALPSIQQRPPLQPGQPHLGRQRLPRHVRQPAAPRRPARRPRSGASACSWPASSPSPSRRSCAASPRAQGALIGARFLQGVGAAAQASVILAIIVTEFPEAAERARAMSAYVFVSVAGGSLGLLAGGLLTQALSWHWVFFVNLPIGLATFALGHALIRADRGLGLEHGVDWLGSLLVTASLMSAIYAIVEATNHGWISAADARVRRPRRRADGRVRGARGPHRQPDHAPAHPAPARPDQRQPGQGLPGHGHVLDLLPRHALPRARAPLHRAADRRGVPALDAHRRRPLAGHHRAAGRALRGASASSPRAWRTAAAGLLLFSTVGPGHGLLPDGLPRLLRDRPRASAPRSCRS